ncbi:MAG: ATP-binding protein [Clostridiales bacterium]|nr:ATP-binding protein [Clostridiales bacterium]
MGSYLNPGADWFKLSLASEIYVDKTNLISYTNKVFCSQQRFICISRPRRFGKSMAVGMLAAYYSRDIESKELFEPFKISKSPSFESHLNECNVIYLDMQEFLTKAGVALADVSQSSKIKDPALVKAMIRLIEELVLDELIDEYPDLKYKNAKSLNETLKDIFNCTRIPFVFLVDEWDCIFRTSDIGDDGQKDYLDYLRLLFKDRAYVGLAYMTGILPIKKYGRHSALNMFKEFSMTAPLNLAEYVGFTDSEVRSLCERHGMSFEEIEKWYDGYSFPSAEHVYNPLAVVSALTDKCLMNYWSATETFEALKDYIVLGFDGLKDTVCRLMGGGSAKIRIGGFQNDMSTFSSADDVLTLLMHLGYLNYNSSTKEASIPNDEIMSEFVTSIRSAGWSGVIKAVEASQALLKATWRKDAATVANAVGAVHAETSILTYNDENALSYVVSLAYYAAREYYTITREMPAGEGFADLVLIPSPAHQDKPAMIIELKWNKTAQTAIERIKEKNYPQALKAYAGNLLIVGINYDKVAKIHSCVIEELQAE